MKSNFIILVVVLGMLFIAGCIQNLPVRENEKNKLIPTSKDEEEITPYPEQLIIYQDYLDVIEGESRHFQNIKDIGTIEATVISLTKSEVCPYLEEECRIESYPKDVGLVRVDKLISYTPYSEQTAQQPLEQPSGEEPSEEEKTTSQYTGQDLPKSKQPQYTEDYVRGTVEWRSE